MITLRNGRKLKVKDEISFFGHKIYLCKVGYVVQLREDFVFASLFEAEGKIIEIEREKNLSLSTYAYTRKHCLQKPDADQFRIDWQDPNGDHSFIHWTFEGGAAVAVKVDSLGRAIDFLSLCDWSNKYQWQLPSGNWHYFTAFKG